MLFWATDGEAKPLQLVYRVVWEVDTTMYGSDGRVFNSRKDFTAHGEADRLNAPLLLSIFKAPRPLDEVWAILLAISGHQPVAGPKPAEKPAASRPVLVPVRINFVRFLIVAGSTNVTRCIRRRRNCQRALYPHRRR